MKNSTVILLAGGKSTRFWPLPHKMTLPLMGKTFLDHQIEMVLTQGFTDIIVVVTEKIAKQTYSDQVKIVVQKGEGQAAALISAKEFITDKPTLVINADDIISPDIFKTIAARADDQVNLIVGTELDEYFPGGYLVLDGQKVIKVWEKPGAGFEPSKFMKLVCDYFISGTALIKVLEQHKSFNPDSWYEDALTDLIRAGQTFELIQYDGVWIPVKYPWHQLELMDYFLNKIKASSIDESATVDKTATLIGPVVLEKGVRVMEYAKLVGPVYIGAGTIVGNHTLVRQSMVGENCVIGFSSDVTRSYMADNCWFHSNYLGDSVIASDVGMGAGAILANLRLDEGEIHSHIKGQRTGSRRHKLGAIVGSGVRIGVGVYIMPGVKVGQNSSVGAGVLLQSDLPDNKRCYIKQTLTIEENTVSLSKDREKFRKRI